MVTVIKFSAEWCGPCRMLAPAFEQMKSEFPSGVQFIEYDVDNYPDQAVKYGITSVPNVVIEKDGMLIEKLVGSKPIISYKNSIDRALLV